MSAKHKIKCKRVRRTYSSKGSAQGGKGKEKRLDDNQERIVSEKEGASRDPGVTRAPEEERGGDLEQRKLSFSGKRGGRQRPF